MADVKTCYQGGTMREFAGLLVLAACSSGPPNYDVVADVAGDAPIATIDGRYLSFAVDTAQVVGGTFWDPAGGLDAVPVLPYDFGRPRLVRLARELAPAYLRIGGTDADRAHVDLSASPSAPPPGYRWLLTAAQWDGVAGFARAVGLDLFVTLNAGPGPRGGGAGPWMPDDARALVTYATVRGDPVRVWELGNELNAYSLVFGFALPPAQIGDDAAVARALLDAAAPGARLAAPSYAFWPLIGDFHGDHAQVVAAARPSLDVVTWHYYPQQSIRCPVRTRAAEPEVVLDPANLDELARWSAQVHTDAGGLPVWLGETGNAQCGGEPGVSDAWAGTLWWIDELGLAARLGNEVVVRQTLSGSNYGLIDDVTLTPRPDYWASVVWRRVMGTRVLDVGRTGAPKLRLYAHCARGGPAGAAAVAAINLDDQVAARVGLPGPFDVWELTADGLGGTVVYLRDTPLVAADDGAPPPLEPRRTSELVVPPLGIVFAVLPELDAPACR
jgi:heparanase 1